MQHRLEVVGQFDFAHGRTHVAHAGGVELLLFLVADDAAFDPVEQGDFGRKTAHEHGVADRVGFRRDDGDALVDHVVAVADGAQADGAAGDGVAPVVHRQALVDDAGRHDDGEGAHFAALITADKGAVLDAQAVDAGLGDLAAIFVQLGAQIVEQHVAAHTLGKTGVVVRDGNPAGAAVALVEHRHLAHEAAQINGGGQAAGTAADDEGIVDGGCFIWLVHGRSIFVIESHAKPYCAAASRRRR